MRRLEPADLALVAKLGYEGNTTASLDRTPRGAMQRSFVPAGAGQVAKFEDLIEEASAELDRVEAQLQTASQEKVVLQSGNAQLMTQTQESAAVKTQASHNRAVVVWMDIGTAVCACPAGGGECSCSRAEAAGADSSDWGHATRDAPPAVCCIVSQAATGSA